VSGQLTTAGAFTIDLVDGQAFLDADFGVAEVLPNTGTNAGALGLIGLILLALGTMAVLATRRRKHYNQ